MSHYRDAIGRCFRFGYASASVRSNYYCPRNTDCLLRYRSARSRQRPRLHGLLESARCAQYCSLKAQRCVSGFIAKQVTEAQKVFLAAVSRLKLKVLQSRQQWSLQTSRHVSRSTKIWQIHLVMPLRNVELSSCKVRRSCSQLTLSIDRHVPFHRPAHPHLRPSTQSPAHPYLSHILPDILLAPTVYICRSPAPSSSPQLHSR